MTNSEKTTTNEAGVNAEQGATVATEKGPSNKNASLKKGAPRGKNGIKDRAQDATPLNEPKTTGNTRRPKLARSKAPKKTAPAKKGSGVRPKDEPTANATGERVNKKAEVIALMKRAKGATLPEITAATGWQKHTVRGFVSILGSKGGENIESSKNADGDRTYRIAG